MIRNRLAELLAERKLKISRVANDIPNLSRNTITSTASNETKMIQIETINSLCQYLEITPSDFFEYIPFDVKFSASLNRVKWVDQSNPDSSMLFVKNLELDVYAEQTFLNANGNQRKQTFDLMCIQNKNSVLPVIEENNDDSNPEAEIHFSILLGHTTDKESYANQQTEFSEFWNSITPGFLPIVKEKLMSACSQALTNDLNAYLNGLFDSNDPFTSTEIDWGSISKIYDINLGDAYSFNEHEPATIEFVHNPDEPSIDISDDDLPF